MAESKLTNECKVELTTQILAAIKDAGYKPPDDNCVVGMDGSCWKTEQERKAQEAAILKEMGKWLERKDLREMV